MNKKPQAQLQQEINEMAKTIKPGAIYVHYKNPAHTYKVLQLAINTEDDSVWVVYQSLYDEQVVFLRSAAEWCEEVEKDGRKMKRFYRIGEQVRL